MVRMNAPKSRKQLVQEFVNSCTLVFKSFEYDVVISKNKSNLWHYTAAKQDKKYVVYCAPEIKKVKGLLKVAINKIPKDHRLVVICNQIDASDEEFAEGFDFTLVTLEKIKNYGEALLEAQIRESD